MSREFSKCHGELVGLKHGVQHLTSFYLTLSAGGAAGSFFVALVAPHLFTLFVEFELSLALALVLLLTTLFLDRQSWVFSGGFLLPAVVILAAIAFAYSVGLWFPEVAVTLNTIRFYPVALLIGTLVGMGALIFERSSPPDTSSFRFVQILVAAVAFGSFVALYFNAQPKPGIVLSTRNFYAVDRVFRNANAKVLVHGQTTHGAQLDPPNQSFPITYYGPESGIGVLFRNHPKRSNWGSSLRIGVVGLGVGTLATYGRPRDAMRFYELGPDIIALSSGASPTFTYLRDSRAG